MPATNTNKNTKTNITQIKHKVWHKYTNSLESTWRDGAGRDCGSEGRGFSASLLILCHRNGLMSNQFKNITQVWIFLFHHKILYCCRSLTKVKFFTDQVRPALGSDSWLVGGLLTMLKNMKTALFQTFSTWHRLLSALTALHWPSTIFYWPSTT